MADPVSLETARAFLRVGNEAEDGVISLLLAAAKARVEGAVGLVLTDTSPAPLRLCVLLLTADAFDRRDATEAPIGLIEPWLAPYRVARL